MSDIFTQTTHVFAGLMAVQVPFPDAFAFQFTGSRDAEAFFGTFMGLLFWHDIWPFTLTNQTAPREWTPGRSLIRKCHFRNRTVQG